ncbi:MAG: Nif3-like dinuclear metal center hexameric protein [Thermoguttaceae bacterium]|nr:Nif3-like dinuclear metal center hexameric protein [Thermoguttaceae bacterium]
MQLQTLVEFLDAAFPSALAEDWDNVGLLLGDRRREVRRVLTCLTIDAAVVEEAVAVGADCVVSHHPFPFRAAKRWTADEPNGAIILGLLGAQIAVYSPHTAHDSALYGVNRQIAARLGLRDVAPLYPGTISASETMAAGLSAAERAAFSPDEFSSPLGTGRVGNFPAPKSFAETIALVKSALGIDAVLATGEDSRPISRVAIGCGAADDFVARAAEVGADALLLGEARFHAALEARARGVAMIQASHFATERFAMEFLAKRVAAAFPELYVQASEAETDPIRFA